MDDGPLKNFWENCNGVEIAEVDRDRWAETCISYIQENPYSYIRSGNSIVFAVKDEDSKIEIFDCIIKKTAKVTS